MKERKFVKLRVDMYGDTKFKIIDNMEERDLIHYIWTRLLTLAGKVNLQGDLYMSKSIAYTVETLAIEFNRSIEKVQLALNVFKDLEMIELTEDNVYRVRNFAKHQNIKVKEKIENVDNKEEIKNEECLINNHLENQDCEEKDSEKSSKTMLNKKLDNENRVINIKDEESKSEFLNNKNICFKEKSCDINSDGNLLFDKDKNKKKVKKHKKKYDNDIIEICNDEDIGDICEFTDESNIEGELVKSFNFA